MLLYGTAYFFLGIIVISGFFLLIRNIYYAYNDTCVFFAKAFSMKGIVSLENNYVTIDPSVPDGEQFGMTRIFYYNLFLNIIRLFPQKNKLRYVQCFNLTVYLLYMAGTFYFLFNLLQILQIDYKAAIYNSFLFTLLIGARTKMMFVACFPQSDIINYLLFIIALLLVSFLTSSHSFITALSLGVVVGLAYRNRYTDVILILAALSYLIFINASWWIVTFYAFGVLLSNIDALYWAMVKKENPFPWILKIWRSNVPVKLSGDSGKIVVSFLSVIASSLKTMFNFYSEGSFGASMGSSILVFPISIVYLYFEGFLKNEFIFLLIYFLGFCFVTIFIRRNQLDADNGTGYFGNRQVYILFPIVLIFNATAFSFICINENHFLITFYILWILFYILHQIYRVLSYYFSDQLSEREYLDYRKTNFAYMKEIAAFIGAAKKPLVLMGYALYNDEAHNFYNWSRNVRCVNVRFRIDDKRALDIINRYKVTHVIISPIYYFVGHKCSLGSKILSPLLAEKLRRVDLSPQVIVYEVL